MSEETRRKLRLLPEVLPDPLLNRDRSSGPRDRTLIHMQRLLATAAAATAAATAAAGCGDKTDVAKPEPTSTTAATTTATATASAITQTDPVPPHTAAPDTSSSAQVGGDPHFADLPDAGVKKTNVPRPPQPPPTHYMVVDPVPQPYIQPPTPGKNGPNQP